MNLAAPGRPPVRDQVVAKLRQLKEESGTHSPSLMTIRERIPDLEIAVDACFLSNPYATDLFLEYFKRELLDTEALRDVLEFYPSQNSAISEVLARFLNVPRSQLFIGNGATEIIQAIIHRFTRDTIAVNIPTFSPYYEFAPQNVEVLFHHLRKEKNYKLDLGEYGRWLQAHKPNTIILINPNNPDGGYIERDQLLSFLESIRDIPNVIVDESFIHFANSTGHHTSPSLTDCVKDFPNLFIVKSMSKDFGIAGIRAGYAVMSEERVHTLLKNGYLWNSNGLAEYFFRLYGRPDFNDQYESVRIRYVEQVQNFYAELQAIPGIRVYPTSANFVLVELLNDRTADQFVEQMLIDHGVYLRSCRDKIGLEGEFVRVAGRNQVENRKIIEAFRAVLIPQ